MITIPFAWAAVDILIEIVEVVLEEQADNPVLEEQLDRLRELKKSVKESIRMAARPIMFGQGER